VGGCGDCSVVSGRLYLAHDVVHGQRCAVHAFTNRDLHQRAEGAAAAVQRQRDVDAGSAVLRRRLGRRRARCVHAAGVPVQRRGVCHVRARCDVLLRRYV
jgi:hypothetical protein